MLSIFELWKNSCCHLELWENNQHFMDQTNENERQIVMCKQMMGTKVGASAPKTFEPTSGPFFQWLFLKNGPLWRLCFPPLNRSGCLFASLWNRFEELHQLFLHDEYKHGFFYPIIAYRFFSLIRVPLLRSHWTCEHIGPFTQTDGFLHTSPTAI